MFGWLNRRPAACDLTPAEAQALVSEGKAVLVDVREESEWRSGHVPGAVHLPLSQFSQGVGRLPRDKKVILYCLSGGRSAAHSANAPGRACRSTAMSPGAFPPGRGPDCPSCAEVADAQPRKAR